MMAIEIVPGRLNWFRILALHPEQGSLVTPPFDEPESTADLAIPS
jgi:hypothetical protein